MNRLSLLMVAPLALYASVAQAAETGDLRGRLTDPNGAPVTNAEIVLLGVSLGGEIRISPDASGNFRFINLPPGTHDMLVIAEGYSPTRLGVTVRLGETSFVPVRLQAATTTTEEIVVEGALPVIDATRSGISTNLTDESLADLPVGRSYQDAVNLLPGVYGRVNTQTGGPGNGNPSVRGEGQYGNNYLVDGVSTRDPATKTFGTNVNFDAIQEIQVFTDGAPAEFGQATGMLVNVVTKDGGDEHHGTAGYWTDFSASFGTYDIANLETHQEEPTEKRTFWNHEVSLTAGGPIKKEKLWYFATAALTNTNIHYEGMPKEYPYSGPGGGGFVKLTWFMSDQVTVRYQVNAQALRIENYETSSQYTPEAQAIYNSSDLSHLATIDLYPTELTEIELQGLLQTGRIDVVPASGSEEDPSYFNFDTGQYTGNYDSFDYNTRGRQGVSLKITHFVDDFLGDHKFKVGAERMTLNESRYLKFTGPGDGVQYFLQPSAGQDCTTPSATPDDIPQWANCAGYRAYNDVGAPLGHRAHVFGMFIQDDWQPVDPVTLNIGVRADREVLYQNAGQEIYDAWMPAPRLGAAWDITNDSKTMAFVNAGRYYDVAGNTFADWGDTRSAFVFNEYDLNEDTGAYDLVWSQDPEANPLVYCNEQSLAAYDEETRQLLFEDACQGQYLRPYHMDKIVVGFEREILPLFAVGIRGILSQTVDLPEDIDYDLDHWVITNPAQKRRDYRGIELTAERKFDENWQLLASYTLSESKGHTPGQFELASGAQTGSNGNEVGVYLDDVNDPATREFFFDAGYGWLLDGLAGLGTYQDDAGYYGYLPYHSFHQLKINGSYKLPFGTTLGLVYEFDSGHAWQKRGWVDLYQGYFSFPEGRGSRFMPAVHYIDFHVGHEFELANNRSVEVTADLFNLPDLKTPITYYENDDENFGLTLYRQSPRAARVGVKLTY